MKLFSFLINVVLLSFISMSCTHSPVKAERAHFKDSTILSFDSFCVSGHSYIQFMNYNGDFDVIHNPDCYCRYNRTFIVVKHGK